jgi:hypothetical protein
MKQFLSTVFVLLMLSSVWTFLIYFAFEITFILAVKFGIMISLFQFSGMVMVASAIKVTATNGELAQLGAHLSKDLQRIHDQTLVNVATEITGSSQNI